MRRTGGCAACGQDTPKRTVSPYEDVSAISCDECQHVVTVVNQLVDPAPPMAQSALRAHTLRRLRRVDQVVGELIRRRMVSTLIAKGNWDDIWNDAPGGEGRYPMPNSRPNCGWGD